MNLCSFPYTMVTNPCPALEHIDESFFFFNSALEIEYLNKQAWELSKKIYGRHPELGDSILEYVSPGRRKAFKKVLEDTLEDKTVEYEIQVENTDIWLFCKYFPGKDENGVVNGVYGLLKDISAKKAFGRLELKAGIIEKSLFESRLLFEQFMQNSPLVSWLTDAHGTMHYMNPVYLDTYGFSEKDLGKSIFEMYDAQIAVDCHMNNHQVIKTGKAIETIEKGIRSNGVAQVLKVYKFPLLVNNQVMVGGWAVDITDQVELQERLIESVERYEYVNKATSDAIYDWNIATGRIYRGASYAAVFGYAEREASIKTRLSLVHPDDYEQYKQNVFAALRNQKMDKWKFEYRFRDAEGNYKVIVDKACIIRSGGKAIRVIGAMQDITPQKELQQKIINQETHNKQEIIKSIIEAQEKERRQLSVELHDNVNQMLASCKLMLEVAIENKTNAQVLTQKSYQSIQTVINEIRRISHHLNPSAITDVGLAEAIEQLIDKINISGRIKIKFLPDRKQYNNYLNEENKIAIFRIVQEQLNNILKHSKATNVLIRLEVIAGTVKICIKDNGIGFDPTACKKGMGLRNIYNRIEYLGGTVHLKTGEGKGVKMCVALKVAAKPCVIRHLKIA